MDINDYLLPHDEVDWATLLAAWEYLFPEDELEVWFANRFGEPVVVLDDGSVHRLDLERGILERLADDREAFADLVDRGTNADDWLRLSQTDAAVAAGLRLGTGQCYGYATPLILGEAKAATNLCVRTMDEYYGFLADVHAQLKDVPDGTQVVLRRRPTTS